LGLPPSTLDYWNENCPVPGSPRAHTCTQSVDENIEAWNPENRDMDAKVVGKNIHLNNLRERFSVSRGPDRDVLPKYRSLNGAAGGPRRFPLTQTSFSYFAAQLKKKELTLFDDSERNVVLVSRARMPRCLCLCPRVSALPSNPHSILIINNPQAKKSGYNAIFVVETKEAEEESGTKATGGFNMAAWEL